MRSKTTAEEFFYAHAGFGYNLLTQTPKQGKRETARKLAEAEEYADEHGWWVEWVWDTEADPLDWSGEGPIGESAEVCSLFAESGVLASLCGIWDATQKYRRVVEAELALEAMEGGLK